MIKYPDKPWADGQTFTHTTQEGDEIAGIYDAPTNTWTFYKGNSDLVFTNTVYTVDVKPAEQSIARAGQHFNDTLPLPNVDNLVTQQDVNWYLYDLINSIDGGSQIWVGLDEPPGTGNANPITKFWWKDDEEQLYVWDTLNEEWKLTGLMDFDRPPIVGSIEPLEHPKFPGKPIEQGDLWYNTSRLELFIYWMGAWFPTSAPSTGFDGVSTETFTFTINRIQSIIDEVYLKNIEQDNRLDTIEENIVELEEEIDAIAPSNERGEWNFNPAGVASPGNYAFLDSNTQPTERFDAAATIYVSTRDAQSTTHSFNNHEAGEYLQIFNKENDGYGLYQITDIDDNSSSPNPFFAFTVDFVRSLVTTPKAVNRGRFKFFTIAEGDPGAYVLKTGDEMSGDLKVDSDIVATGKYLGAHYNGSTFNTFPASVEIIENSGMLKYGSRRCMFWNDNGGVLTYGNRSIFGWSEDNSTAFKPIKIYDTSLVVDDNHVIHKGYVDEQIAELLAKIEELEMSGGQPENIRIETFKVGYPRSGTSQPMWKQIGFNELVTSSTPWYPSSQQNWKQADLYFYICLPNEYQMNPTGGYIISQPESGRYPRNSDVCNMTFDAVESHPLQDNSTTHTVWKVGQIPTDHKGTGNALQEFAVQSSVVLTFYGGSMTKVTS